MADKSTFIITYFKKGDREICGREKVKAYSLKQAEYLFNNKNKKEYVIEDIELF